VARFQALTSPLLESELETLRQEMGLRDNQKAELLREITAIASWVIAQARAGRVIEARGPDGVEVLHHPAVHTHDVLERVVLAPAEADRLEALLAAEPEMSPALQKTLQRLADPDRAPPVLSWSDRTGPAR
jgi:hypothetical protein